MKSIFVSLIYLLSIPALSIDQKSKVYFPRQIIYIGNEKLNVEVAKTGEQHEQGLMFRTQLKEGRGMLFIFSTEQPRTFWMKNTFLPLSVGFFNSKKTLVDIQEMAPAASEIDINIKTYTSHEPAQYAIEAPRGWFAKKKIKLGTVLKINE